MNNDVCIELTEKPCKAKIAQLYDSTFSDEDILWLHISVYALKKKLNLNSECLKLFFLLNRR